MGHDVFISHSSKNKATADAVCAALEAHGIQCWIAPRDVTPSMEWSECIVEGIEECRIMLLVFTADANASPQIRREIERAANHGATILPLRVEDVLPGRALEYFIGNVHWLDAMPPPLENHLPNVAITVERILEKIKSRETARHAEPGKPETGTPQQPVAIDVSTSPFHTAIKTPTRVLPKVEPTFIERLKAQPLWLRAVFGVVVLLIVLLPALYFLMPTVGAGAMKHLWAVGADGTILESSDGTVWNPHSSSTSNGVRAIFGTSDGKRFWAVGDQGTILESDDSEHWTARVSGIKNDLYDIFGTKDGKQLWAVGDNGTILESDDGTHWTGQNSGTSNILNGIFGTPDGKDLWAVGDTGTILAMGDELRGPGLAAAVDRALQHKGH